MTYQLLAVRTGAIVTMVNTGWIGTQVAAVMDRVIAGVAARQRAA